jgi:uncharacterized protein (TIGR02117 family)
MKYLLPVLVCWCTSCTTLPQAVEHASTSRQCPAIEEIYVLNHGWHTGIALKAADLNASIPSLSIRFPEAKYYEIGWGDAGFYQSNEITTGLTFRAMFWSSGTVMHVVGFKLEPDKYFPGSEVRRIMLNRDAYKTMLKFIKSSFKTNEAGDVVRQNHGLYGDSQFYTGIGNYYILNTCNKWTAKALYSAGLDIDPGLKLTASSITNFLDNNLFPVIPRVRLSNCTGG